MKSPTTINYQEAGMKPPAKVEVSAASMTKLRIFKDHLNETPIVIILVGSTPYELDSLPLSSKGDFIKLGAALDVNEIVLCHADYLVLPQLDLFTQIVGARIYVLDDVPDLERSPSEMMAIGSYRHRVSLEDFTLLLEGKDKDLPEVDPLTSPDTAIDEDSHDSD